VINGKKPRTIQIFLPTGDPSGIRVAEITTSIIRVIEVPRNQLSEFMSLPESKQVGLYFLVGRENQDEVYIGQSGDIGSRLSQHNKDDKKDWERALVLVSLTNNLTQTHVLYLESLSIEKGKSCKRYEIINGNGGQKPYTPIPLKADCDEMHEIGSLLLATLGYPIFEPLLEQASDSSAEVFYCTRKDINAKARYTNEGMVVLEGSRAPMSPKKHQDPNFVAKRDDMLQRGILVQSDNDAVFTRDFLFKTPSGASGLLVLGASNGWTDWKTKDGKTLKDRQRNGTDD
jgi:predicted GIY-YIG superfamily endonuclease